MSLPFLAIHLSDNLHLNSSMIGIILGMSGLTVPWGAFSGVPVGPVGAQADHADRLCSLDRGFFRFLDCGTAASLFGSERIERPLPLVFRTISQALMADVSRPEQRLRIFNLRYVAINVGMVVGPVIGSYLYYHRRHPVFFTPERCMRYTCSSFSGSCSNIAGMRPSAAASTFFFPNVWR